MTLYADTAVNWFLEFHINASGFLSITGPANEWTYKHPVLMEVLLPRFTQQSTSQFCFYVFIVAIQATIRSFFEIEVIMFQASFKLLASSLLTLLPFSSLQVAHTCPLSLVQPFSQHGGVLVRLPYLPQPLKVIPMGGLIIWWLWADDLLAYIKTNTSRSFWRRAWLQNNRRRAALLASMGQTLHKCIS